MLRKTMTITNTDFLGLLQMVVDKASLECEDQLSDLYFHLEDNPNDEVHIIGRDINDQKP